LVTLSEYCVKTLLMLFRNNWNAESALLGYYVEVIFNYQGNNRNALLILSEKFKCWVF
jgi:hypothetical protein